MAVQTTYTTTHTAAVEGAVVDGQIKNVRSAVAATVAIPMGRFVARGASDGTVKLPTATGEVTATGMGVAIRVQDDAANSSDVLQYEIGRNVSVLDFGVVWVKTEEAVVAGDNAFVRFASGGGGTLLGSFRKSADTATAVALPGAYFLAAAGAAGLVPVRIRMNAGV